MKLPIQPGYAPMEARSVALGLYDDEGIDPSLVVEVQYDHFSNGRFRHGARFLRWRPDKAPTQRRLSQVERPGRYRGR